MSSMVSLDLSCVLFSKQGQQGQRIDARAGDANGPMQVRSRHAPGRADKTDEIANGNVLAFAHVE